MSLKRTVILSILFLSTLALHAAAGNPDVDSDTIWFEDGAWYLGEISDSLFNGAGKMVYADSTVYEGQWKDGLWNGKGKLSYPDGDSYEGEFLNHEFSGYGIYNYSNGAKYAGYWERGMFNGAGTMDYADGSTYAGNWKDDLKDGLGVLYDAQTGSLYKGYFENDLYNHPVNNGYDEPTEYSDYYSGYDFTRSRPDTLDLFHYTYDVHIGFMYGTEQILSFYSDIYFSEKIFAGLSLSFNVIDHEIGKPSVTTDDETGNRITLVGWNDYPDEIMTEVTYTMFRMAAEFGVSRGRFSLGTAIGMGIRNTVRNCRSLDHNDSFYAPGTHYFRNRITGVKFNYDIFTDIVINQSIPFLYSCSLRAGWGNLNGIFMGLSVAF